MEITHATRLFGAVLAVSLAASACDDDILAPDPNALPQEIQELPSGLHPVVSIPGLADFVPGGLIRIDVYLYAVDVPDGVAAYQGELSFVSSALSIKEGGFAEGVLGAWNEASPGTVRFAGAALEGIGSRPILQLTARAVRAPAAEDFTVVMEEVIATQGFANLTAHMAIAARPVLTRAVLDLNGR